MKLERKILLHGLELESDWNLIMFVVEELELVQVANRFGAKDYFSMISYKLNDKWNCKFTGRNYKYEEEAVINDCSSRKEAIVKSIKEFISIYETGKRKSNYNSQLITPDSNQFLKNKKT